jgi:hypothetical protein
MAPSFVGGLGGLYVSGREIAAFEQQRHLMVVGAGVRKAIAHVQGGRVPALSESLEGGDGFPAHGTIDCHDVGAKLPEETIDEMRRCTEWNIANSLQRKDGLENRDR